MAAESWCCFRDKGSILKKYTIGAIIYDVLLVGVLVYIAFSFIFHTKTTDFQQSYIQKYDKQYTTPVEMLNFLE